MKLDWKFFVTTVLGVVVPVLIWQADLTSRSLHFQIVSQTSLQPGGSPAIQGIQLSIDGIKVASPFITVLKLAHDGSRPIQAADFESPIQVTVEQPAMVLKAEVTEVYPQDLRPVVDVGAGVISIKPLLLNSGDTITVAVITSGAAPKFTVRSRIAGIPGIKIQDRTGQLFSDGYLVTFGILSFLYIVGASILANTGLQPIELRARASLPLAILVLLPATLMISLILRSWGIEGALPILLVIGVAAVVATPLGIWLNHAATAKTGNSSPAAS